ncbi:MAG TPA: hypothetical protein VIQ53_02790 [Inquilinus sp.]
MADPLARFDGTAVWATLDPEQQAAIGAAALELVALWNLRDRVVDDCDQIDPHIIRVEDAALDEEFIGELQERFVDALPREALEAPDGSPLIPSFVGPICGACGCTDNDACRPPCSWVEPNLCSACKGAADV